MGELHGLERLSLDHTFITSEGLNHLSELNQLTMLYPGWTSVDDISSLADLANLESLRLDRTQ